MLLLSRLLLCCLSTAYLSGVEPWADRQLPVQDGLALWLDANVEAKAQVAAGLAKGVADLAPGWWHDGSAHRRHARQEQAADQPQHGAAFPVRLVSFSGTTQHLVLPTAGLEGAEATIVLQVRVQQNPGDHRALLSGPGLGLDLGASASVSDWGALRLTTGMEATGEPLPAAAPLGAPITLIVRVSGQQVRVQLGNATEHTLSCTLRHPPLSGPLLLGARRATDGRIAGALTADVFEVLLYERALTDAEVSTLRTYLTVKYGGVVHVARSETPSAGGTLLHTVKDPPVIQPLVPGFTARRLPVSLTNINLLRYRPDGRLYAGGYDGRIHLLHDSDGDGLEDHASLYYQGKDLPVVMGMVVTPPGYARGEGLFVITRGRVLFILDHDRNGTGDEVITLADGWPTQAVSGRGVSDALGLAMAPDGSLYFGLGADDFTNAYRLDRATGRALYQTSSERGTIQRLSADFSRRETIAHGLRITYGAAFNPAGDLFVTDQEGATWLANGNPYDELLHIQPGRHYGFPPRHPLHLPEVIDEPSTFDYGPQHQSTVGLCFNEPLADGMPMFGPAWWRGEALVSAMSRGKIYRTRLVKTASGYVARNETLAQFQRIIVDQAVSPRGALTVTLHSGVPDWGSGPQGMGELWQLAPVPHAVPRPVMAWSASSRAIHVTFDQPVPDTALAAMRGKVQVVQGRYAQAGERFENMRPGYQVVRNQLAAPRFPVTVENLALQDDGHTLVITTAARTAAVGSSVSIAADLSAGRQQGPYAGQLDVLIDLTGVDALWEGDGGRSVATWLPHLDHQVVQGFTTPGVAWRAWTTAVAERGTITLRGQLDLRRMLQPEVQDGSSIDWQYPEERVRLHLSAERPFRLTMGGASLSSQPHAGRHQLVHEVVSGQETLVGYTVRFAAGSGDPGLTFAWTTSTSDIPRPFPLRRLLVPYALPQEVPPIPHNEDLPQLAGGRWQHGRTLFQAMCAACHRLRDDGHPVGPDLANLVYRDHDSVLKDIRDPNATINPDHVTYTITRRSGEVFQAVVLGETERALTITRIGTTPEEVPRTEISKLEALRTSLMPVGLDVALGPDGLRDLMTYLLVPPLEPAPVMQPGAPAPRPRAQVERILGDALTASAPPDAKPLRIVLCASEKDRNHLKPGLHDYPLWRSRWTRLLNLAPGITAEPATDWPTSDQWERADVVAIYSHNPAWSAENDSARIAARAADLDRFLARGGGLVVLHYAVHGGAHADVLAERLGWASGKKIQVRMGANAWVLDQTHPVAAGIAVADFPDESYWDMTPGKNQALLRILATSVEDSAPRPQMWTREVGPGRVFVSIPGHSTWTFDDPLYRILVLRGMMWSAGQPMDRLAPLTVIGARVQD